MNYGVVAALGLVRNPFRRRNLRRLAAAPAVSVRPARSSSPTSAGSTPSARRWTQPNIRYYIFAFLFVVFDVEAAFLFPWALVYERLGLFAVVEMFLFIAILAFGLVYAWGRKLLDWDLMALLDQIELPKPIVRPSTGAGSTPSGRCSSAWPAARSRWRRR